MKTLYLHIGTLKTATTYIQDFLQNNREILKTHGLCFPEPLTLYQNIKPRRNAHFLVGTLRDENGDRDRDAEKRAYEEEMNQIHSCLEHFDSVILSDESIWRASAYTHKTLFQKLAADAREHGYQIKIIVYLRRQDQFLLSLWNQKIRTHSPQSLTLDEYRNGSSSPEKHSYNYFFSQEEHMYDYAFMLNQIAEVLEKENLIVRRFEPSDWKDGSILADFLDCLGLSLTPDLALPEKKRNTSLKGNTCEIRRLINKNQSLSAKDRHYLGGILRGLSDEAGERYPCSMMSAEEARDFLKRYEEGNAQVAKEYLRDGKPLFSDEIEDLPKWEPDNPYMMEDVIHFFCATAADLHQTNQALQDENRELRRELEHLKDQLKHPARALVKKLSKK